MKNLFTLLGLLVLSAPLLAQDMHCGTDGVMKAIYDKNPHLLQKKMAEDKKTQALQAKLIPNSTYVIPVVFHILHMDGPENISDDQVKDGLRILNRDFAKKNPDTTEIIPAFKNLADSMKIQFVLATKDPLGNCTNGIKHYYDPDTDWDENSPSLYSHTWDPTKYMNVYIVRKIIFNSGFGAAGYTYFPGTWPIGDSHDAIVVLNNYFGSIGTGSNFLSRVLTHEVGHWLDLYHVFGGTNGAGIDCSGDDYVNDTPTSLGYLNCPNPSVPSQYQICTPGVSENFQNYMDYSYCCRMFTPGQGQRMQLALQNNISGRDNLVSNANLVATGVINPNGDCVPIADFKFSRVKTCVGTAVTFTDASWNGQPTSYSWTFAGGTPASSTASVVTVTYNNAGNYSVIHSSSNSAGNSTPIGKANLIQVVSNTAQFSAPWSEGFENLSQLNTNWTTYSSSGSTKWEQSSDASYSGTYSAKLDASDNTRKNLTALVSPMVNVSAISNPHFTFKLAAAEVTTNHINNLKVSASIDCGDTWTVIYDKTGQNLVTTSKNNSDFVPLKSDWRTEIMSLQQIASATSATFKFEYKRDTIPAANNIYIDDINILTSTSLNDVNADENNIQIYPVPATDELNVLQKLKNPQDVTFTLRDLMGRELMTSTNYMEAGEQKKTMNLNQPAGIYFIHIKWEEGNYSQKLVISGQ
ncbi:MAG: T9SS type A sorting domain-containing protein [Bacteroidia bacterium]|nr:T9SS type A sorting domain-containing protein [Bacteroidia bacterium]